MKIIDYIRENGCDIGGIDLGRIKSSAWNKIKDIEIKTEREYLCEKCGYLVGHKDKGVMLFDGDKMLA